MMQRRPTQPHVLISFSIVALLQHSLVLLITLRFFQRFADTEQVNKHPKAAADVHNVNETLRPLRDLKHFLGIKGDRDRYLCDMTSTDNFLSE